MHGSLNIRHLLRAEFAQRRESGYDVDAVSDRVTRAGGIDHIDDTTASAFLHDLEATTRPAIWEAREPEDLDDIRDASEWPDPVPYDLDTDTYVSAVHRAWNGRIVGNMLGKPVENWSREDIKSLLEKVGEWPLASYFPSLNTTGDGLPPYVENGHNTTRGNIDGSARDDDIDYTILNLSVLREFGPDFTTSQVGMTWLERLPFLATYTAERVAIRNMISGDQPAHAATRHNPYREFIGAAIRADVFGMVAPGDAALAATLAYRDAVLSHTANGVYGEMFCAALVASAFTASSAEEAVQHALCVVPNRSRLHGAVSHVLTCREKGLTWDQTRDEITSTYGHYSPVHTISNAAVLVAGLLYGDADFDQSIGYTVMGGLDTDSNAATAGAVSGILARNLDSRWTDPLNDTIRSAVFGYDGTSIKRVADDTAQIGRSMSRNEPQLHPSWHLDIATW
jgi:ADP-ribosylglycohydrolase